MSYEQAPGNNIFEGKDWELPTDVGLIDDAEENFVKNLSEAGWTEDEIYPLQLGFIEALINAMAHGNLEVQSDETRNIIDIAREKQKTSPTEKKVYVSLNTTPDEVSVTIRDEGKGFNWRELQDPTSPERLLKPFGRGTLFMGAYDSITRNDAGNELTLTKKRVRS